MNTRMNNIYSSKNIFLKSDSLPMGFHIGDSLYKKIGPCRVITYYIIVWALSSTVFILFNTDGNQLSSSVTFEPTKSNEISRFVFNHPIIPMLSHGYKLSYCFVQPEINLFNSFSFKFEVSSSASGLLYKNTSYIKELNFNTLKYYSSPFYQETHSHLEPHSFTAFVFSTPLNGLSSVIVFISPISFLIWVNIYIHKVFHSLSILIMMFYMIKLTKAFKNLRQSQDKIVILIFFTGILHIDPFQIVTYFNYYIPRMISSFYTSFFYGFLSYYLHCMIRERLSSKIYPTIDYKLAILYSLSLILTKFSLNILYSKYFSYLYIYSLTTFIALCSVPLMTSLIGLKWIPNEKNDTNRSNKYLLWQVISIYLVFIALQLLKAYFYEKNLIMILSVWLTTLACGWAFLKRVKSEDSYHYLNLYAQEREMIHERILDKLKDLPNDAFDKNALSSIIKSDSFGSKSNSVKNYKSLIESSSTFT